ncbi:hypothetical protein CSKR_200652 [Clonorchis sinensis]|uniref:Uncharacterized protein n=1 Tax=Clonorchis sinensis TaxID=79923 RepID=A0A8T1MGQ3_CLOSI|nr:hypothetical protein CSKR_200652 [Clonorchis sinensis]
MGPGMIFVQVKKRQCTCLSSCFPLQTRTLQVNTESILKPEKITEILVQSFELNPHKEIYNTGTAAVKKCCSQNILHLSHSILALLHLLQGQSVPSFQFPE